jgi:histone-lysine N-methyltransferase SETMAR
MTSQGISTVQTIQDTAVRWQDHGKCVLGFRWIDSYFLPHGAAVNTQYYSNLLHDDMHKAIQKRKPGQLPQRIILLNDKVRPHTTNFTNATMATMGWEIMNHPLYSPDLSRSDFHLFGSMNVHLKGQKFQTDNKVA